jgi:hypothetical protein
MVAEGQQRIEIAQMAETRAIEESRQGLEASLANMEKDLAVAQQNGQMDLARGLESRKLAVQQQISINEQILAAVSTEGAQAIDIAGLIEQRNINQARLEMDAELANLQARKEVAIAEGNNALAGRIETSRNTLQKERDQKTLALQAMTEEGRQQLENKSLDLTAALENARNETTVSVENMRSELAIAVQNNDSVNQARLQASINRVQARGQKLTALINEGDLITDRAALVQRGELTVVGLVSERANLLDQIEAQVAVAEAEGNVDLANSLLDMRDNHLARSLNAAIASEEFTLQERSDLQELIVNKGLSEARIKLDAILGEKSAQARGLDTLTSSVDRATGLLAELSESEKDRLLDRSQFLDTLDFSTEELESQIALDIARLESGEDIAKSTALLGTLSAMGALDLDAIGLALETQTGIDAREQDFVALSAGQALDFIDIIKTAETQRMQFAESAAARRNGEIVMVSSFLKGTFFEQAVLDDAQAKLAINAEAVERQAIAALKEIATMSMNARTNALKAKQAGDEAGWTRYVNIGQGLAYLGEGIGGDNWAEDIVGWLPWRD